MDFERRKAATLASLGSTETDKSPKGTLDTPIIPLINTLNQHPCYFTTSSCSGRISILSQPLLTPTTDATKFKKKARGGSWLFVSHDPADPDSVLSLLFPSKLAQSSASSDPSELVFRFEPLIIAVECKDLSSAQSLVSLAISCGFRESGITNANKRVIIAIRCSIRLEVPLGDTNKIMVSHEYARYLVEVANEKMEANRKRTERFHGILMSSGFIGSMIGDDGNHVSPNESLNLTNGYVDKEHLASDDDQVEHDGAFLENKNGETYSGFVGLPDCNLSIVHMAIVGEPMEKLFLWGHSACTWSNTNDRKVLVFGGFGGMGRHARRNDSLLLDPYSGTLETINANSCPTPRLGHTASIVGDCMFVIGGRTGPDKILGDLWVLDIAKNCWKLLQCGGCVFPPRHRHAAAVVGSNIYIFGGLDNESIFSSFYVLDTIHLHWKEVLPSGDRPCARHSHAMVAYGSQILMFGGYSGEKALGDLYSFDIQKGQWKKEKTEGRSPHARFSHSMFVYKNHLGVIGGCPVRQHCQELALLDFQHHQWKDVTLNSVGKDLFVRSAATVVGDDLVMIGGGAACYAFGTKFSEPAKLSLSHLMSMYDNLMPIESQRNSVTMTIPNDVKNGTRTEFSQDQQPDHVPNIADGDALNFSDKLPILNDQCKKAASRYVLRIGRKCAKLGKDILKKLGWLDQGRKAYSLEDGVHIYFPVTEEFSAAFNGRNNHAGDAMQGHCEVNVLKPYNGDGYSINELCCSKALALLHEYGATMLVDEVVEVRTAAKSPLKVMTEAVASLLNYKGLPAWLLEELPTRWDRLGDIVVLPISSFKDPLWDSVGQELWQTVSKSLSTHRLARQGRVAPTGTRDSTLQILVGDNGWVSHRENGIIYSFDATKCMFSWGNLSEKLRMGCLDCKDEVVVDLYAGIGYFVLPFLVRARAKLVYACEWNPHAVEALQHNLLANSVADRCVLLEGDNQITAPKGVADRVCLGLIPSSERCWVTAVKALRREGGTLHVHGNAKDSEESQWTEHVLKSIHEIARTEGYCWEVSMGHVEQVKWYAPHIRHLVADVRCRQTRR